MGQIVCTDKGILAVEQNKVLIPPAWNKTFAWGYADLSCRLGTYESDKVYTASLHPFVVATTGLDRGRENQALSAAPPKARRRMSCFRGRGLAGQPLGA